MTTQLIPVPFHGDTIYLFEHAGEPYTPVKPYCEVLGLAWQPQARKLDANKDRWGITIMVIPSPGGLQETICLPLRKLPAYLYSIDPRKVKSEVRAKVELYQSECDEVLWRHWAGQISKPATVPASVPPAPETVTLTKDEYIGFLKMQIEHLQAVSRPRHRSLSDQDKSRIKGLRAQGLGSAAIGTRIGRSRGTVGSYLRRVRLGEEG